MYPLKTLPQTHYRHCFQITRHNVFGLGSFCRTWQLCLRILLVRQGLLLLSKQFKRGKNPQTSGLIFNSLRCHSAMFCFLFLPLHVLTWRSLTHLGKTKECEESRVFSLLMKCSSKDLKTSAVGNFILFVLSNLKTEW